VLVLLAMVVLVVVEMEMVEMGDSVIEQQKQERRE
jgi:hypothetical protein